MATKNIVPNDNGEGGIGVTGKRWNTGFINTITGNLTGNVTGNASGTAATVTGAAQSNITSLGTLTGLSIKADSTPAIQLIDENGDNDFKSYIQLGGNDMRFRGSSGTMQFYTGAVDGASSTLALSIDNSQNATFAGAATSSGNITGSRLFSGDGGNKTNPMIANGSDQDTGIFFPASNTMAFSAGDTESFRIAGANATFAGNIAVTGSDPELTATNVFKLISNGGDIGFRARATSTPANGVYYFGGTNANPFITPAVTIVAGGDITAHTGNLVIGTAGKGIDFSAYGAGSTISSNLLDDYEEGTWTPSFQTTGTSTTVSYNARAGTYSKIGNRVTCSFHLSTNATTWSGVYVQIDGQPFSAATSNMNHGFVSFAAIFGGDHPRGIYYATSTRVYLTYRDASDTRDIELAASDMGTGDNNNIILGTFTYQTAT
mgnify:CR=1 FL=1